MNNELSRPTTPTRPTGRPARRRRRDLLIGGLVLTALAAGCSGDDPSSRATAPSTSRPALPWGEQPVPAVANFSAEVEEDLTVIDAYVSASDLESIVTRRDEAAVRCLAERGIDVELEPDQGDAPPADAAALDITRAEYAARWGFGLVAPLEADGGMQADYETLQQQRSQHATESSGYVPMAGQIRDIALARSLFAGPDAERLMVELYGTELIRTAGTLPTASGEPCRDVANEEVGLVEGAGPLAAAAELRDLARERVANDPRIIELKATYGACLADHGFHDIASPTQAYMSISEEFGRITQSIREEVLAGGTQPDAETAGPEIVAQLEELGAREVALATANVTCEGPFVEGATPVSEAIQQRVIDDNAALVAQLGET